METAGTLPLALITTPTFAFFILSESGVYTLFFSETEALTDLILLFPYPHRFLAHALAFALSGVLDHTWPAHVPVVPGESEGGNLPAEAGRR